MAIDKNLIIYNAAPATSGGGATTDFNSTALTIDHLGVGRNAQLVVMVPTAATTDDISVTLQVTTDASTWHSVGTVNFRHGFKGQRVANVSQDAFWAAYLGSNIQARVVFHIETGGSNWNADATGWGTVVAAIGYGESEAYGRAANAADALAV